MNPLRYLSGWLDLREQAATEAQLSDHLKAELTRARKQRDECRVNHSRLAERCERLERENAAMSTALDVMGWPREDVLKAAAEGWRPSSEEAS